MKWLLIAGAVALSGCGFGGPGSIAYERGAPDTSAYFAGIQASLDADYHETRCAYGHCYEP